MHGISILLAGSKELLTLLFVVMTHTAAPHKYFARQISPVSALICWENFEQNIHENILVYKSQQDAQVTEFILSDNCSTCFGRHYHPSSGAQNNCNYSIW